MKKKLTIMMLLLTLVGTAIYLPGQANGFYFFDVPETHWAYENIKKCYDDGIVKGITTTKFDPSGTLTNGQFVTMVARAIYSDDVNIDSGTKWYSAALEYFNTNNLLSGTNISEESVSEPINRALVSQIVYNIIGEGSQTASSATNKYTDLNENLDMYSTVIDSGILTGYKDATFQPNGTLTRAEASTVIQRLVSYMNGESVETPYIQDPAKKIDPNTLYSLRGTSLEGKEISTEPHYGTNGQRLWNICTSGECENSMYISLGLPINGAAIFENPNGSTPPDDLMLPIDVSCYLLDGTLLAHNKIFAYYNEGWNHVSEGDSEVRLKGQNFWNAITNEENLFYVKVSDQSGREYIGQPLIYLYDSMRTDLFGIQYVSGGLSMWLTYDSNGQIVFDKDRFDEKIDWYNSMADDGEWFFPVYN